MTYLLPSLLASVILNIPKFLEARLTVNKTWDGEMNMTRETVLFTPTRLRLDQDYVYYYIHWTRLELALHCENKQTLSTTTLPRLSLSLIR